MIEKFANIEGRFVLHKLKTILELDVFSIIVCHLV